jgi:2-hydroxy-3-keto-5-methylthiopentenyl-1-phosphate phosphatase
MQNLQNKTTPRTFSFEDVENAFAQGLISLKDFAEVLSDNFGKKKARKILRNNLDEYLKEMKMTWEERQEHLQLISFLI